MDVLQRMEISKIFCMGSKEQCQVKCDSLGFGELVKGVIHSTV